jgi:hypothetical protein
LGKANQYLEANDEARGSWDIEEGQRFDAIKKNSKPNYQTQP